MSVTPPDQPRVGDRDALDREAMIGEPVHGALGLRVGREGGTDAPRWACCRSIAGGNRHRPALHRARRRPCHGGTRPRCSAPPRARREAKSRPNSLAVFFTVDERFIALLLYGLIMGALFGALLGWVVHHRGTT
jgi:hypothetical protein